MFTSINPATGQEVATYEALDDAGVESALALAEATYRSWRNSSIEQRVALLNAIADHWEKNKQHLAEVAVQEMGKPLAGAKIGGPFALIDENGRPVTDRSFAGKYRVMYFGYTYCPDVCPVDVQTIAQGLAELEKRDPALAARVVPIFVTVDPARDTPAVLKQFTAAFSPRTSAS